MEKHNEKIEQLEADLVQARANRDLEQRREVMNLQRNSKFSNIDISTQKSTLDSIDAMINQYQRKINELDSLKYQLGVKHQSNNDVKRKRTPALVDPSTLGTVVNNGEHPTFRFGAAATRSSEQPTFSFGATTSSIERPLNGAAATSSSERPTFSFGKPFDTKK